MKTPLLVILGACVTTVGLGPTREVRGTVEITTNSGTGIVLTVDESGGGYVTTACLMEIRPPARVERQHLFGRTLLAPDEVRVLSPGRAPLVFTMRAHVSGGSESSQSIGEIVEVRDLNIYILAKRATHREVAERLFALLAAGRR